MQEKVFKFLRSMYKLRRVPNALLFYGKEGVGKKSVGFEFAKGLLCLNGEFPACGRCFSCKHMDEFRKEPEENLEVYAEGQGGKKVFMYLQGEHPDFIYLKPQRGEIKIDQIRGLKDFVNLKPALSQRKLVLIADADTMNPYAQNALLKTLEEPPQDTYLLLTAGNQDRLLPTVRSRVYSVEFQPLSRDEIKKITGINDDMILSLCEGSLTKAKKLLEKKGLIAMAETIIKGDPLEVYNVSLRLEGMEYEDQKLFLYILESFIYKSMLDEKENYEVYQSIINRVSEVNEGINRGARIGLAIFYIHILLGGENNALYKG